MGKKKDPSRLLIPSNLRKCLSQMPEKELRSAVVEPLLQALGFTRISETHGPNEKGRDYVCFGEDPFKIEFCTAIQVKHAKLSSQAGSKNSLHSVVNQLEQALTEDYFDKYTSEHYTIDRVVLITPHKVPESAWANAKGRIAEARRKNVQIIDGDILLRLLQENCPEILRRIGGDPLVYGSNLQEYLITHHEASAFKLTHKLTIPEIFVSVLLRPGSRRFFNLISRKVEVSNTKTLEGTNPPKYLLDISQQCKKEFGKGIFTKPFPFPKRSSNSRKGTKDLPCTFDLAKSAPIEIDLSELLEAIADKLSKCFQKLVTCTSRANYSVKSLQQMLRYLKTQMETIEHFLLHDMLADCHIGLNDAPDRKTITQYSIPVPYKAMIGLKEPLLILGEAGYGKTTLLRKMASDLLSDGQSLVIYYPLSEFSNEEVGLLGAITTWLQEFGAMATESELDNQLKQGFCSMFLDGLDEAAAARDKVVSEVENFVSRYPRTHWIVSSRDSLDPISIRGVVTFTLLPFDKAQLVDFFSRALAHDKAKRNRALRHLARFPFLARTCTSPLMASILAGLVDNDLELPRSKIEVYERRFTLLLEEWDRVKRVHRTLYDPRLKKYILQRIAYSLHENRKRAVSCTRLREMIFKLCKDKILDIDRLIREFVDVHGILIPVRGDILDFGHLSYQEFLAAQQLLEEGSRIAAEHLGDPWWANVIRFYSAMRLDISDLIKECKLQNTLETNRQQLASCCKEAVLTRHQITSSEDIREGAEDDDYTVDFEIPEEEYIEQSAVQRALEEDPWIGDLFKEYDIRKDV